MAGDHTAATRRPEGRSLGEFPWRELSTAEKTLLECCVTGKLAHFGDVRPSASTDANRISPKFLRFLAVGGDNGAPVHEKGVQVEGAWIDGDIDFEGSSLPHRLSLRSCQIDGALQLRDAQIVGLNLEGTFVRGIVANRLRCTGALLLWRKFHSCGGLLLIGAKIDGTFDCEGGTFEDDEIALDCDGAQFGGRVFLNKGFEAIGEVRFRVASLSRGFDCRNGRFNRPGGTALNCTRADIVGSAFLGGGFFASGEVQLIGTKIGGDFDCEGGRFENSGGRALNCEGATIGNRVFLRSEYAVDGLENEFCALGEVRLAAATVGGDLDCDGGRFANRGAIALACDSIKVGGRAYLRHGFHATGAVRFPRAKLGMLACEHAAFENPRPGLIPHHPGTEKIGHGVALNCVGAEIGGEAHLRHGFEALGRVDFTAAKVARDFSCEGARLHNPGQTALSCDGAMIGGRTFLRKHAYEHMETRFYATGEVRFIGAKLDGGLDCEAGMFEWAPSPQTVAADNTAQPSRRIVLYCDGAQLGNDMRLNAGFRARGEVSLIGIVVNGDLTCEGGSFINPDGNAVVCQRAEIKGLLFFRGVRNLVGKVWLTGAHAAALVDDAESWKEGADLSLDGFTYDRLGVRSPVDAGRRKKWLRKQGADDLRRNFKPQPWNQIAHVLNAMGHEDDAKKIRIEMRKLWRRSRYRYQPWHGCIWGFLRTRFDWLLGGLVRYGYRPWWALAWLIAIYFVGAFIFMRAATLGVIVPSDAKAFQAKGVPAECSSDWVTLAGPPVPSQAQLQATADPAKQAALRQAINDDIVARGNAAKKFPGPDLQTPSWREICGRAMPPEYVEFDSRLYALELLVPVLDLKQKGRWAVRTRDDKGKVIGPDCTLFCVPVCRIAEWATTPLSLGPIGVGHLVRLWQWFEIMVLLFFSLLLVASVSGIIKKE